MTNQEFSTEFDVLFNNVTSNQAPGLNEYEKSVFLTKGQSQLVNEYFNQRTDGFGGGFDGGQRRQYDFSELIKIENLFEVNSYAERVGPTERLDRRSKVYLFPQDYFLAVNEILSDDKRQYAVTPISHSEYQRLMLKPYNFPVKRGAWRLITNKKFCNYVHLDKQLKRKNGNIEDTDFSIITSYGNKPVNLRILYVYGSWSDTWNHNCDSTAIFQSMMYFKCTPKGYTEPLYCSITCTLSNINSTDISLTVRTNKDEITDNTTISVLQSGFEQLIKSKSWESYKEDPDNILSKCALILDGLKNAKVPDTQHFYDSDYTDSYKGVTFNLQLAASPMIELIGKFTGEVQYQLRYIHSLKPIILEDLTNYGEDLTIDGISNETECELPEETHQEILERAVTLAKIAWQGGTMTGAAQQAKNG